MPAVAGQMRVQTPFTKSMNTTTKRSTANQRIVCASKPNMTNKNHLAAMASGAVALHTTFLAAPVLAATEAVNSIADGSTISLALGGGAAIAALSAALIATDPQKRRAAQMEQTGGDELEAVKNYFNTAGYDRWRKIYGETDEVNKVQLDIRQGHAQTVEKVLKWIDEEGGVNGLTVCDAGCGTGSLAVPLALRGATVSASDISSAMANEAKLRYENALKTGAKAPKVEPVFEAMDLESCSGKYNTVSCLDVMIHYPQDKADAMISHLASLAEDRLIISFAPKTLAYSILKRIGELFPGPSKATRAYLHKEDDVEAALVRAGFKGKEKMFLYFLKIIYRSSHTRRCLLSSSFLTHIASFPSICAVTKREMTATSFYFSRLLEAKRVR